MAIFPRWIRKVFRDEKHWVDLNFFRGIPVFRGMTGRQLGRVMAIMQKRKYRAGELLFAEGATGRAIFVIQSGSVELSRKTSEGKKNQLGVLGSGQVFGEMALLENRPRTASATVVEDGTIYLLYTASLESLMRHQPTIGVKLMRNIAVMLSTLLRRTNEQEGKGTPPLRREKAYE